MGDVVDIGDAKPHVTLVADNGNVYVLPVEMLEDLAGGGFPVSDLDHFEHILPVIVREWLEFNQQP